jgi:hypothetical protein
LIALSIAITADYASASTADRSDRQGPAAVIQNAPSLRDAWKKALVYLALLATATYGSRIYRNYADESHADEIDDPVSRSAGR